MKRAATTLTGVVEFPLDFETTQPEICIGVDTDHIDARFQQSYDLIIGPKVCKVPSGMNHDLRLGFHHLVHAGGHLDARWRAADELLHVAASFSLL